MIFVTVGGELPFDRLVRAMDAFAAACSGEEEVVAQIGRGGFEPGHMRWTRSLGRADYAAQVARAELIVAHAGMGSVLTAGEHGKPVVLLPRRARFGEHRNDHQLDTVGRLGGRPGVFVAAEAADLPAAIAAARAPSGVVPAVPREAPPAFLDRLRAFVLD